MRRFKVIVGSAKTKDNKQFTTFKVITKDNKKIDLHFTKDCKNIPSKTSYIIVEDKNVNVDNSKLYPVCWVKNVEKIEEIETTSNLDNYFEEVK